MTRTNKPRILLATGIFYPDVGGPAIHVRKIGEFLVSRGYEVRVITYGEDKNKESFVFPVIIISRSLPSVLRWSLFLIKVFRESLRSDILYAFNLTTAGIPVFLSGKIFRRKILIRVPGDPIWERLVEKGARFISFANYYRLGLHLKDKPGLFKLIRFILGGFDRVVFYSPVLRDMYIKYYNVLPEKTEVIYNPVFRRKTPLSSTGDYIIFAGRFVSYKNLPMVIRAFDVMRTKTGCGRLVLIGRGPEEENLKKLASSLPSKNFIEFMSPVGQDELFRLIAGSRFGIGPALTEFNPNFILECLSLGKPVLLSRENGLSVELPQEFLFDPSNADELEKKMANLFSEDFYNRSVSLAGGLNLAIDWHRVLEEHLEIIKKIS